uniref:HtrA serine peptidase 4 n=1 Tax=Poecilia latipinna TaxID=48699 RepID=A0A3B3TZY8_9TELE
MSLSLLRKRHTTTCPQVCDQSQCPVPPHTCCHYRVKDACGCCVRCGAWEGEVCGESSDVFLSCGDGLRCDRVPGRSGRVRRSCVCISVGEVCGSDGRNRRANLRDGPLVLLIHRGPCDSGMRHPGSMRYKFNFIPDVVEKIAPAVAHLELFQRGPFPDREVIMSSGSGFVVSEDGWILTNAHVLKNKQRVKVELKNGVDYEAAIKDVDEQMDVASSKLTRPSPSRVRWPCCLWAGEFMVAVGSPFPLQNTVTIGISSSAHRKGLELDFKDSDLDYIHTDAIINYFSKLSLNNHEFCFTSQYGNSGRDVIGINNLKVTAGISFAIPSDRIRQFLADFHNRQLNGKDKFLGVRMMQLTPSLTEEIREHVDRFPDVSSGVYIHEVIPGTAASRYGWGHREYLWSGTALPVVVRRNDGDFLLTVVPEEKD